jgi:hypothetical protein
MFQKTKTRQQWEEDHPNDSYLQSFIPEPNFRDWNIVSQISTILFVAFTIWMMVSAALQPSHIEDENKEPSGTVRLYEPYTSVPYGTPTPEREPPMPRGYVPSSD